MKERLGVGLVAAGPVTQSIHLPTIAAFPDELAVRHVMDVDPGLAKAVAERCPGASYSTDLSTVLADDRVDIVVIGSPDAFHADQVIECCERGVRGILCEKPLTIDKYESARIMSASLASGVPVIVGTMHGFDPAWLAAEQRWSELGETAELVRCRIQLPSNDSFVSAATQLESSGTAGRAAPPDMSAEERAALILRRSILGLLIHSVPIVRQLVGSVDAVAVGEGFPPFGSRLVLECGSATVEMSGLMPGAWEPNWQISASGQRHEMLLKFPPSYVSAGSARAEVAGSHGIRSWQFRQNGYHAEWRHVIDAAKHEIDPFQSLISAVADINFAIDIREFLDTQMTTLPQS